MHEQLYALFHLDAKEVSCRFLYPAGWIKEEIMECDFFEVYMQKPPALSGGFGIFMVLRIYWDTSATAKDALEKLCAHYRTGKDFRELGKAAGIVSGYPAVEIEFAWKILFPFHCIHAQWVPLRERHIFFRRGRDLWELYCAAAEEQYSAGIEAFRILVKTLAFQGIELSSEGRHFHPIVDFPRGEADPIDMGEEAR